VNKKTYTYKQVENCEIRADVYNSENGNPKPVLVYIHGGALISGNRKIPTYELDTYLDSGYAVVSIDYRLAPETKLKEIVEDIQDAFAWVHDSGRSLFGVDPKRIGVIGHSAGGYLTLLSGYSVDPAPKALVSFYGYGDIVGDWYSKPDPFYREFPLVAPEMARKAVGEKVLSEAPDNSNRSAFYLYCRQNGMWPLEVTGHNPGLEPGAFEKYCPVRNVNSKYPPTLLLHGDKDTDVPCEQSKMMAEKLAESGVAHELMIIRDRGHGFDEQYDLSGNADSVVSDAFSSVISYLQKYV
jgi:acetyl esterase/lipase